MAIQPLNYSTQAIEALTALRGEVRDQVMANTLHRLITLLHQAQKFILPNRGALLDPTSFSQTHLDMTRLPYPCTVFEASWQMEDGDFIEYIGDYKTTPAPKRIALCWDSRHIELLPGMNRQIHDAHPEGGTFVLPIFWASDEQSWMPAMGGTFLPFHNELKTGDIPGPEATNIATQAAVAAGLAKPNASKIGAEPFFLMPDAFEEAAREIGRENAMAQIILDCRDEAMMVIAACSVLNCANVVTADMPAPAALNKKRIAKDRPPLFSYKVLQLDAERVTTKSSPGDGTHAPPRMHLRRGHMRRLEEKTIWVRAAVINASSPDGVVAKDYALRKPQLPPAG